MTDNTQPEALRLAEQYDYGDPMAYSNMWKVAVRNELIRQHARIAELEAARFAYASEFEPNSDGYPDVGSIHANIRAMKAKLASIGAGGVQELSAAPAGPWSLGEMTGNWRDIDLPDHGGIMRIVWKMEDDEERNEKLEAQAHAVVAALNAAFSTPPAEPQAQPGAVDRTGCTAGTDEECTRRGCATSCPAQQAAPKAAPGVGNSGFDHQTAADFLSGKTVSDESVRKFVQASRWAHDEKASLSAMLLSVRGELASRNAEIALLKRALMEAEAAPQQEAQEPVAYIHVPHCTVEGKVRPVVSFEKHQQDYADGIYSTRIPLYTAPQPAPLSDPRITAIEQAIRDYHYALDCRKHGGVAKIQTFRAICNAMKMHWAQGQESERRAALAAQGGK